MYTQCPDCSIAFRVTAQVLKQAAGKVRCGGCQNAFNALDYLSEQVPDQVAAKAANTPVPELKPEIADSDTGLPKSISAEQSAALLKTLDQLAGSDIRIEDTGVEWRVLDEDEAAAAEADNDAVDQDFDDGQLVAQTGIPVDELRFDDNTPLPEDFDLPEPDATAATTAESSADLTDDGLSDDQSFASPPVDDDPPPELALSEPDEWADILGEFQAPADDETADSPPVEEVASRDEKPLDVDSQFALQAEAMGIDLSGVHETNTALDETLDNAVGVEDAISQLELLEETADVEPVAGELTLIEELAALESDAPEDDALDNHAFDNDAPEEEAPDNDAFDNNAPEEEALDDDAFDEDPPTEQPVPVPTDAEHSADMQIDQELMAMAVEDEDGFASTIIISESDVAQKADAKSDAPTNDESVHESGDETASASGFEAIVMEGESVHSDADNQGLDPDSVEAGEIAELVRANAADETVRSGSGRYGLVAGVVGLLLLFGLQLIHQSREALATIPAFSNTVGQVYRILGQPLQPAWNVRGWRIEASDDVIDIEEGEENLTVYSRIGNNSEQSMPYPLINISLTDRFLEPVGSQILDPAQYLPTDLDPAKLVDPGNTFNAVISIKSPSTEAAGYKVDVCYRLSDNRLRCAIDDFK